MIGKWHLTLDSFDWVLSVVRLSTACMCLCMWCVHMCVCVNACTVCMYVYGREGERKEGVYVIYVHTHQDGRGTHSGGHTWVAEASHTFLHRSEV